MNAPKDETLRHAVPTALGVRQPLIDGVEKVTGRALYTADLPARIGRDGALVGAILRSPLAHARIRAIDTRAARALPGVRAVVTGDDCDVPYGVIPMRSPRSTKRPRGRRWT